ncbi:heme exporter protein CcmB [uncultured Nevskia sp.]|uniref:heme exporter protein CcmB n=1 Tax=uncultured Nevskia sp. TaxID=228950 RepID=UPI0026000231|nr:heme exporter protein CcmB [uncultured Nevskia sp.]
MSAVSAVFRRELSIALRRPAEWVQPLVFYGIVALLFPLGIAPDDPALKTFAPAIVWVGALLSALLGVERLFRSDLDDGTLEQMLIVDTPLAMLLAAKLAAQWLLTAAPLVVASPLIGYGLGMDSAAVGVLGLSLLLGTPTLVFTGGFAAALTVGAPRAGLLLPILVLPLMTPAVIFGGGAVRAAAAGLSPEAPLYFLGALLALSLTLLPVAAAGAVRNALG